MPVITSCPNCGAELAPIALIGGHPPWACAPCQRAWWEAELEPAARQAWDPLNRYFTDPDVVLNATTEQMAAELRGTSLTPDTARLVADEVLDAIRASDRIGAGMRAHLESIQRTRGRR